MPLAGYPALQYLQSGRVSGIVLAEVVVPAVESDDGKILGLVVAILGQASRRASGHGAVLSSGRVVPVLLAQDFRAAPPTTGG
jgi:hypothetical protein